MGCAIGIVKYLTFIANLIFAVGGLVLLIVGVLYKLNLDSTVPILKDVDVNIAPTMTIVIGAIIFLIAFLGCCGAIRESTCMLITFAVILLVLLILQIAAGTLAFLAIKGEKDDFKDEVVKAVKSSFEAAQSNKEAMENFETLQKELSCCGYQGPADWINKPIPDSCYEGGSGQSKGKLFTKGCGKEVYDLVKNGLSVIGYIVLAFCVTELFSAIFALCIVSSIRNSRRRGGYA